MGRHRTWTNEQLKSAVQKNISMAGVLRDLNLSGRGSNSAVHNYVKQNNLDTSHWLGQGHRKGSINPIHLYPLENILVENSTYRNQTLLKKRLIKAGILENKCAECNMPPFWNKKPLELHLHHINRVRTDNRIENLQLSCPNCHTQEHCERK